MGHQPALAQWASSTRSAYLDNLKVLLIAGIIVIHAVLGYAETVEVWTYTELREVTLSPVTETVLFVLVSPFGLFLIALLFLVAGLLTPASLDRKGVGRFVADRCLRLGVTFGVYVLLIQPVLKWWLFRAADQPRPFGEIYLIDGRLDSGPLWFVGVLLVFSVAYAGWHRLGGTRVLAGAPPITLRTLLLVAAAVAPFSFAVRLWWPYGSESGFTDLNFWEWPVCAVVFVLGATAAHQGWLHRIPDDLAAPCRRVTLIAVAALVALLALVGSRDAVDNALGGAHWESAAFAVIEGPLTVCGSVWLLSVAQRHLDRQFRWGPVLARSAFAAFVLQSMFLLGIAVALRPLDTPAEVKALLVAAGAVIGSFGVGWLLATRIPGLSRVL